MSTNSILATAPLVSTNYLLRATGTTIGNSLIFDNGTNVGIGNTNTTYKLDVSGTGNFTGALTGTSATFSGALTFANGGANYLYGGALRVLYSNGTNTNNIYSGGANGLRVINQADTTALLTITDTGNVGIGTSSPSYKLDILGSSGVIAKFSDGTTNSFIYSGSNSSAFGSDVTIQNGIIMNGANSTAQINTSGQTRLFIKSGGDVGIGTAGQVNVRVEVKGGGTTSSFLAALFTDSSSQDLFYVRCDGYINTGTRGGSPYNLPTTGRNAVIESNGGLGYTTSTRESKTNINSITDINWINQLNPVSFNYRKKDNERNFTNEFYEEVSYGFIADEVEKVNTDFVFYDIKEDGTKKLAGVEYNNMIAILTKAIQELSKQNEELSNRLIKLESK
jgi:hypothetical protein